MNTKLIICLMFALMMTTQCAAFKKVVRTVNDVANGLCLVFAAENEQVLNGMSISDWCKIQENLSPFIEYVTMAQKLGAMHVEKNEKE